MKNHYKTLGLLHDAEEVVIKAAYKALAQKYHPDRHLSHKTENTAKMALLNEAYAVIGNPALRKIYDDLRASLVAKKAPVEVKPAPVKSKETQDLIIQLDKNALDEIQVIDMFEKAFDCRIRIHHGWINTYSLIRDGVKQPIDFETIKSQLVAHLSKD
jgi:curved DNA-binding protein CbpA